MGKDARSRISRREAMTLLGMSAAGLVAACGDAAAPPGPTVVPDTSSLIPAFPDGAIIRTILRDMSPNELAHGATLFHEHMSLTNEFWLQMDLARLIDPSRPYFMQDLDFMIAEMRAAADDGIVWHRRRGTFGHGPQRRVPARALGALGNADRRERRLLSRSDVSSGAVPEGRG